MATVGTLQPSTALVAGLQDWGSGNFPGGVGRANAATGATNTDVWRMDTPALDPGFGVKQVTFRGQVDIMQGTNVTIYAYRGDEYLGSTINYTNPNPSTVAYAYEMTFQFARPLLPGEVTDLRTRIDAYGVLVNVSGSWLPYIGMCSQAYVDWTAVPVGQRMRMVI